MSDFRRIEDKRREQIRNRMAQLKAEREAQPQPAVPERRPHVNGHVARGEVKREIVLDFLRDGQPYTIAELGNTLGFKHTSVAAMMRDLRKPQYGSHVIDVVRIDGDHYFTLVR